MDNKKRAKNLNEPYLNQINVLKTLADECSPGSECSLVANGNGSNGAKGDAKGNDANFTRHWQIFDLAERSGIKDEKEMLRLLYILEGQKLVSPVPPGDFTSKIWSITSDGKRALKSLEQAAAA